VFYNRKHIARVVSIECGAVVSFVTIEIGQIRYDTSSRTVRIYMPCFAL
jgi:molybdopterin-binding protein